MKRNYSFASLVFLFSLLLASCSGGGSPEALAKSALKALVKGDYAAYAAGFDLGEEDQAVLADFTASILEVAREENGGLKSYELLGCEKDEKAGTARISARLQYGDGSDAGMLLYFKKVKGKWRQLINQ